MCSSRKNNIYQPWVIQGWLQHYSWSYCFIYSKLLWVSSTLKLYTSYTAKFFEPLTLKEPVVVILSGTLILLLFVNITSCFSSKSVKNGKSKYVISSLTIEWVWLSIYTLIFTEPSVSPSSSPSSSPPCSSP